MKTEIIYFGQACTIKCDLKCEKAWGANSRPTEQISDNIDDYEYLADGELGDAPRNPGTYEGGHGKPFKPEKHNKWCARACERVVFEPDPLPDFSKRVRNIEP